MTTGMCWEFVSIIVNRDRYNATPIKTCREVGHVIFLWTFRQLFLKLRKCCKLRDWMKHVTLKLLQVWDLGKALTIKEVYTTGYVMVAVSSVLAVVFASL